MKKRKKIERASRLVSSYEFPIKITTFNDIQLLIPGMIAFFSGAGNREEVLELAEKCRRFGNDLYRKKLYDPKLFQRFPHAGYEAEQQYSSRRI